ncbi:MAG: hypothetical protein UT05_C0007G0009 [Parcubacteria group bacterium GW2011_GWF2_38_76]|nr:MAG: hypothetical protein UT05_C0007G0009 [Parcubacteria group bacterium GW2011_GWF2_38_76]
MKRKQTVSYATGRSARVPSGELKPMIRLANNFLFWAGFRVGGNIDIDYMDGAVIIKRK